MGAPQYLCRFTKDLTLAAATPQTVDVPTAGARDWIIQVKNAGATNPLTALTAALSVLGGLVGPAVAAADGIPLAHGDTLEIGGEMEPATFVRLVLTSTLGTDVTIEAGGW